MAYENLCVWRSDHWSRNGENPGFSSQATQREGDSDCEGPLGRDKPGDDLGDGGSHEEVLSSPVSW